VLRAQAEYAVAPVHQVEASPMLVEPLAIAEVKRVLPRVIRDERGFFSETYNQRALAEAGLDITFVQDNQSLSRAKGVVRGLHFQAPPHAQGKLVRVLKGAIFDVAVDIRHGSPTFGKHVSATLSAENAAQLWVPAGFAHGFCTIEPDTEVLYKVTDYYAPDCDLGIQWDDPALGIAWPVSSADAILSAKDRAHLKLSELAPVFPYEPA
jgi:dTDP-4-dehydrorhamnose 3,5-epimerase